MRDPLHLAELAASATHDVGGLAGSLTETLELAALDPGATNGHGSDGIGLAEDLKRRVRLLRLAWGPLQAGVLNPAGLQEVALGAPAAHRVHLDVSRLAPGMSFTPAIVRVVLSLIVLAGECVPRTGTLALSEVFGGALFARLTGTRAAWPDGFAAMLRSTEQACAALTGPRQLSAPLLALLAHRLGVRVSLLMADRPRRGSGPAPLLIGNTGVDEAS